VRKGGIRKKNEKKKTFVKKKEGIQVMTIE
jgi:hypothetical protein